MNSTVLAGLLAVLAPVNTAFKSLKIRFSHPPAPAADRELPKALTRARWLMGTVCEVTTRETGAGKAIGAAFDEIAAWDRALSLYKEDSELSRLNRSASSAPFRCSPRLWKALTLSLELARKSQGAFDPTVLPLLTSGEGARDLAGYRKLVIDTDRRTVFFSKAGMGLDFGGIGKGLALDHAVDVLKERGVRSAFINFGGQIYALDADAGAPGWNVAVPGQTRELVVRNASISTSGNAERPGHIVSPFSGRRVLRSDSVTVVADSGAEADAWSTALFVLGRRVPAAFPGRVFYGD